MRIRTAPRAALLSIGLLALGAPAGAEDPKPDGAAAEPTPTLQSEPTPTLHGRLELGINDAIAMGIENNLQVEVERHAPLIAGEDVSIAWGAYDPEYFAQYGYSDSLTPTGSALAGASDTILNRTWEGRSGVRGSVPWLGTSYELGLTGNRVISDFQVEQLSPQWESTLALTASQPLLRNLIWSQPWTEVQSAQTRHAAAESEFQRAVMDVVRDIEVAYWDLVATEEDRRVKGKSVETARALLDQTETQYEVGVVSKVEVVEAEAGVAAREFDLIQSENLYRTAQDTLIDRVLGPFLTPESRLEIVPTDRPGEYIAYEIDVEEATEKAFQLRPELESARQEIERLAIQLKFAKNQRLPELNLEGSYGYTGLGGENQPDRGFPGQTSVVTVDKSFASTFDDYFDADGALAWSVRGVFSVPIGNRAGRHRVSRQELELRRAGTQYKRTQQDIVLQVRAAARDLDSAQQGIEAAERRQRAAEEQFRAERIRLEQGESTPFDVLQREEDLAEAESQRIAAFRVYRNSVAGLERAQGTILRNRNVAIDDARALR
jgi:outer membrane protein TolC